MPKEILDIKQFLSLTKSTDKKSEKSKNVGQKKVLYIKHGKSITKFKLRGKKYLCTFKTTDKDKANKLLQSIPANLTKVDIKSKKSVLGRKKK